MRRRFGPIELRREQDLFWLTLANGENLVRPELIEGFNEALDEVEGCVDDVALVTTGEGKYFCTGFDRELLAASETARSLVHDAVQLCGRLLRLSVPSVCAVNGHAFGIGAMLAWCHDFRVMRADRGYLCLPELALGLPLHPGMWALMQTHIEPLTLRDMLLTGARIGGAEAARRRLVDEAVDERGVTSRAAVMADGLRGNSRRLYGDYKRNLHRRALEVIEADSDFVFTPLQQGS